MRDFAADKNVIEITDGISGDVHEIHVRKPTSKEIASFQARLFERKGKKIINKAHATRLEFGAEIITGFKPGTLGINGVAISHVASDPGYREDWKDLLVQNAPDIVAAVAQQVFEGTGAARNANGLEFVSEDEEDGEGTNPLSGK